MFLMMPTPSVAPYTRQLTAGDLPKVLELQKSVTAALPAGYVMPRAESELVRYMAGTLGAASGVFEGQTLVASALLRIPSVTHPNDPSMPFPIVPEEDWALHAAGLANTIVLPAARGRGYQRMLVESRVLHAKSAGMRWICAGIHLRNSVSWRNLIAAGMAIVGIRTDFGYPVIGLLRKVDGSPLSFDKADRMLVGEHDTSQHQEALNGGYVGVQTDSHGSVLYYRLRAPDDARTMALLYAHGTLRPTGARV
jgi:GNAT superfamily N-acetyltransferase